MLKVLTSCWWIPECIHFSGRAVPCPQEYVETERLGWSFSSHSTRGFVSFSPLCFYSQANNIASAAIASWVKTSVMHILIGDDVTCEFLLVRCTELVTVRFTFRY